MTTWLKGASEAGTAAGWTRVKTPGSGLSANNIGADNQQDAERDEGEKGNRHVFYRCFVVLVRIHVLFPLLDLIK
jgi:hypothetical protein